MPENNRPLTASQVHYAEAIELTDEETQELIILRGGCKCRYGVFSCAACGDKPTLYELIELGIVIADHQ